MSISDLKNVPFKELLNYSFDNSVPTVIKRPEGILVNISDAMKTALEKAHSGKHRFDFKEAKKYKAARKILGELNNPELYKHAKLVVFKNLPHTTLDLTKALPNHLPFEEKILYSISSFFGKPFSFLGERGLGNFPQMVKPNPNKATTASGSTGALRPHSDNSGFLKYAPKWLIGGGVIDTTGTTTGVVSAENIFKHLTPEEIKFLKKPIFQIAIPKSVSLIYPNMEYSKEHPLIKHTKQGYQIFFSSAGHKTDPKYTQKLEALEKKIYGLVHQHKLNLPVVPGQIWAIRNDQFFHTRGDIIAQTSNQPAQRWLNVAYVTSKQYLKNLMKNPKHLGQVCEKALAEKLFTPKKLTVAFAAFILVSIPKIKDYLNNPTQIKS